MKGRYKNQSLPARLVRVLAWLRRLFARSPPADAPPAAPPPVGKMDHLTRQQRIAKYGHRHVTMRGDVVQSKPEVRIANFLHRKGVRYVYEYSLPGATPDFFLPDHNIVIEHWGMSHSRYRQRRAEKTRLYLSKGFKLVETEKKDVPRLELVLEQRLLKADPRVFDPPPGPR